MKDFKSLIDNQNGYTLSELLFLVLFLVFLGVIGSLIYVAIHFISKHW